MYAFKFSFNLLRYLKIPEQDKKIQIIQIMWIRDIEDDESTIKT